MKIVYVELATPLKWNNRVISKILDLSQKNHRDIAAELTVDLATMVVCLVPGHESHLKGVQYLQAIRVMEAVAEVVEPEVKRGPGRPPKEAVQ